MGEVLLPHTASPQAMTSRDCLENKSTDCKRADNTELPPQPSCHLNTTQNTLRDTSKHSLAIGHFSAMHVFGPLKYMAFRA